MSESEKKWYPKEIDAQYEERKRRGRERATPEKSHAYFLKRKPLLTNKEV